MSGLQERIAHVLAAHRVIPADILRDGCSGCDWRGDFRNEHEAHVAAAVVAELGLRAEVESYAVPDSTSRRYVTPWEPS